MVQECGGLRLKLSSHQYVSKPKHIVDVLRGKLNRPQGSQTADLLIVTLCHLRLDTIT